MDYRRAYIEGGCYFFTLALANRKGKLLVQHIEALRAAFKYVKERHPFSINAIVILPDHLHCIWTLPDKDSDYLKRWSLIKSYFSKQLPKTERIDASRLQKGERGIWQRRFWEHCIRDEQDYLNHMEYIDLSPKTWTMTTMRFPIILTPRRSHYEKALHRRTNHQSHQRS